MPLQFALQYSSYFSDPSNNDHLLVWINVAQLQWPFLTAHSWGISYMILFVLNPHAMSPITQSKYKPLHLRTPKGFIIVQCTMWLFCWEDKTVSIECFLKEPVMNCGVMINNCDSKYDWWLGQCNLVIYCTTEID